MSFCKALSKNEGKSQSTLDLLHQNNIDTVEIIQGTAKCINVLGTTKALVIISGQQCNVSTMYLRTMERVQRKTHDSNETTSHSYPIVKNTTRT